MLSPWLFLLDDENIDMSAIVGTLLMGIKQQKKIVLVINSLNSSSSKLLPWCKKKAIKCYILNDALQDDKFKRFIQYNQPKSIFLTAKEDIFSRPSSTSQKTLAFLKKNQFTGNIYLIPLLESNKFNYQADISPVSKQKEQLLHEWGYENPFQNVYLDGQYNHKIYERFYLYQLALDSNNLNRPVKLSSGLPIAPTQPLISIVMRTRNRPALLQQSVQAVINQDYPNIELLVINDGGEPVGDLLDLAREKLSQVTYIYLIQNQGRAVAANTGLLHAQGDYIQFLDDDDLIDNNHLSKLQKVLERNPSFLAAYADIRLENQEYDFNYSYDRNILKAWNYIPIHAVLFSRQLLDKGCCFDQSLLAFEDWDFWIQVSQYTDFYHLPEFGGDYRQTGDSDGGTFQVTDKTDYFRLRVIEKWKNQLPAHELEDVFLSLREYPSANEDRLLIQNTNLLALEKELNLQIENRNLHIDALEKHSESQTNTIETFKSELTKLQQARDELAKKYNALNAEHAVLGNDNLRLKNTIDEMLNSKLWKLTQPIRRFGIFLKSVKKALHKKKHLMTLTPSPQLIKNADNLWQSHASDPNFLLSSDRGMIPTGWVLIDGILEIPEQDETILFFAVNNQGFVRHQMVFLDTLDGRLDTLIYLPENTTAIRIDPIYGAGQFKLENLQFLALGKFQLLRYLLYLRLKRVLKKPKAALTLVSELYNALKKSGGRGVLSWLMAPYQNNYPRWIKVNDSLSQRDRELINDDIRQFSNEPCFSLVIDFKSGLYDAFEETLNSIHKQLYSNSEIIVLVGTIDEKSAELEPVKTKFPSLKFVSYSDSESTARVNLALECAQGHFVSVLSAGAQLSEHALYLAAKRYNEYPEAILIYSDEDSLDKNKQRVDPHFKPDWDPLLLRAQNYIGHSFFVDLRQLKTIGGYNVQLSNLQAFDMVLRISEVCSENNIQHIPQVLFHYPSEYQLSHYDSETYKKILENHINQKELLLKELDENAWQISYPVENKPLVSIIIPTRNGYQILKQCIESIVTLTSYEKYEILVVDNQSNESTTLDYLDEIRNKYKVRVLAYDAPFNYSAINNFAVQEARGEVLAFLNNDIEVITPNWLEEMVSLALMPGHGLVGAMLYYPNDTIQHAGVIAGIGDVAGHAWIEKKRGARDHREKPFVSRYMTVSTAACVVVARKIFEEVEGFNEKQLTVAYNDVDLCLKIHAKGYHNIWTPFAELYHHESVSRGSDDTPEKQQRYFNEVTYMWQQWQELLLNDPAYNPNLSLRRGYHEPSVVSRYAKPWL